MFRQRLLFSLLAALFAVGSGLFGARALACGSAADSGSAVFALGSLSQGAQLHGVPAPAAPQRADLPADTELSAAEDSPDDEELADMASGLLGHVQRLMQRAPASIQLEPAHAPSTQLDRPPRV
jgi:hypothetical protein